MQPALASKLLYRRPARGEKSSPFFTEGKPRNVIAEGDLGALPVLTSLWAGGVFAPVLSAGSL